MFLLAIGTLLLWTSVEKLQTLARFEAALLAHAILPQGWVPIVGRLVGVVEGATGLALLASLARRRWSAPALILASMLFTCFLTYSALLWHSSGPAAYCACTRFLVGDARNAVIRASTILLVLTTILWFDDISQRCDHHNSGI
jgi:hypothetical protein